jgi:hypothetical protein
MPVLPRQGALSPQPFRAAGTTVCAIASRRWSCHRAVIHRTVSRKDVAEAVRAGLLHHAEATEVVVENLLRRNARVLVTRAL